MDRNLTTLAGSVLDVIPSVMRIIRREVRNEAHELTVPQMRILAHVDRGIATAGELAELQGVSLPAISKLIDSMVKRELVERKYRDGNRKQIFLSLTEKGRGRFKKTRAAVQAKLRARIEKLSAKERAALRRGLASLSALLQPD